MTPADRRVTELIDKWLTSIDLHLQYVELSDAAYARVQPWQKHDRPTRWVLEVARQKVLELKQQVETRQQMGDSKFSEALELMGFLANLVGIQHIQRFIPLADPAKANLKAAEPAPSTSASQTVEAPIVIRGISQKTRNTPPPADDPTREMPQLKTVRVKPETPAVSARKVSAVEELISENDLAPMLDEVLTPDDLPVTIPARSIPSSRPAPKINPAFVQPAKPTPRRAPVVEPPKPPAPPLDLNGKIIADAVRLLKWGKPWHELAELIARIAERPSAAEIRKFLRANKAEIEQAANS